MKRSVLIAVALLVFSCSSAPSPTSLIPPQDGEANWDNACNAAVDHMLELVADQVTEYGDLTPRELFSSELDSEMSERGKAVISELEENSCSPIHYHVSLIARIDEISSPTTSGFLIKARAIDPSLDSLLYKFMGNVHTIVTPENPASYPPEYEYPLELNSCEDVWDAELGRVHKTMEVADGFTDDSSVSGSLTNPVQYAPTDRGPMNETAFRAVASGLSCSPGERVFYLVEHANDFTGTGLWSSTFKYDFFRSILGEYVQMITQ